MNPKNLNMRQLTDLLGLDRATIYRWIQQGVFPKPTKKHGSSMWSFDKCLAAVAENNLRIRPKLQQIILAALADDVRNSEWFHDIEATIFKNTLSHPETKTSSII